MTVGLRKSVEQAAQAVLQRYLQDELDPQFGGGEERCIVTDSWPEPDQGLPFRSISILPAGDREDTMVQERDISRTDFPDGVTGLYTFRVAVCSQPIQLDVWSRYASHRDDLLARLQEALRRGERHTLGTFNGNPVRQGVVLRMDPKLGYTGFCDCLFPNGPSKSDSTRGAREREYRATIEGTIDVDLTVQAKSARLAQALFEFALDPPELAEGEAAIPDLTFALNTTTGEVAVTGT